MFQHWETQLRPMLYLLDLKRNSPDESVNFLQQLNIEAIRLSTWIPEKCQEALAVRLRILHHHDLAVYFESLQLLERPVYDLNPILNSNVKLLNIIQTQALMLNVLTQDRVQDLNDPRQYRRDFLKLNEPLLLQLCLRALILPFRFEILLSCLNLRVYDTVKFNGYLQWIKKGVHQTLESQSQAMQTLWFILGFELLIEISAEIADFDSFEFWHYGRILNWKKRK